ncbi:hypothetical protein MKW92_017401 [Papaver armeniacum]|nr:hypothetical protein MKW92_017401 [Papaver armeniacum]
MEKALTKVGSLKVGNYWIAKKAKEEISNIGEDISTFSNTVEEKAKWLFNKLKGGPLCPPVGRSNFNSHEDETRDTFLWNANQEIREMQGIMYNYVNITCFGNWKTDNIIPFHILGVTCPQRKPPKALPDLLKEHNLPPGLFPKNITCYEFDEIKGKLVVHLSSPCEVLFKDSSLMRYATRVKATLSRGKLTGIEGMKTKVLVWVKVTSVTVESYKSDKVMIMAGVKKQKARDTYEMPRDSVKVEEF